MILASFPKAISSEGLACAVASRLRGRKRNPRVKKDLPTTVWAGAANLRSSMSTAEHKHVVLGLIVPNCDADVGGEWGAKRFDSIDTTGLRWLRKILHRHKRR